ncbi:MAG: MFS transporter [Methanomassiliicoccales archaeon]
MNPRIKCILVLSSAAFVSLLGSSLISPILPFYALSFNVSVALVGVLVSSFGLASVLIDMPSGILLRRFGAKRLLVSGLLLIFVSAMICAFAINYTMLLFGRLISGVGYAVYTVTSFTCIGIVAPETQRGRYMSFYLGMLLLGPVSGPAIGGFLGENYGVRTPFVFYGLLSLVSSLLVNFAVEERLIAQLGPSVQNDSTKVGSIFKNYTLMAINFSIFCIFFIRIGVVSTVVPIFASRNLGMSLETIGILLTLTALSNFATMLPAGALTDRYGRKWFMISSLLLTGILTLLIPFAEGMISLALVMTSLGFAFGFSGPIMAWVSDCAGGKNLSVAMGVFRMMSDLGFVAGPLILSIIANNSSDKIGIEPFLVAGLLIIMGGLFLLKGKEKKNNVNMRE